MENLDVDKNCSWKPALLKELAEKFIQSTYKPVLRSDHFGTVLFFSPVGSILYNTAVDTSDQDFLGVFAAPLDDILCFHPPTPETLVNIPSSKPDFQIHEAAKACSLIAKGNPAILELLFIDDEQASFQTSMWQELKAEREHFLTKKAVEQFIGYVTHQLRFFRSRPEVRSFKKFYHQWRLLCECEGIITTRHLYIRLTNEEKQMVMGIRAGEFSFDELERLIEDRVQKVEAMKHTLEFKALPDTVDPMLLNRWLVRCRHACI